MQPSYKYFSFFKLTSTLVVPVSPPEIIMVNPEKPEFNGPFLVFPCRGMPAAKRGTEQDGYYILFAVDNRFESLDGAQDWWTAHVFSQKKIIFKVPAWDFPFFPHPNLFGFQQTLTPQVHESVGKSLTNGFASVDPTQASDVQEARKWKYHVLDFSNVKDLDHLSSKMIFAEADDKESLDFDIIEIPYEPGSPFKQTFLGFKVAGIPTQGTGSRKVARTHAPVLTKMAQRRLDKQKREEELKMDAQMNQVQAQMKEEMHQKEEELKREYQAKLQQMQQQQQQQQWSKQGQAKQQWSQQGQAKQPLPDRNGS
jgi:hypothetical protein